MQINFELSQSEVQDLVGRFVTFYFCNGDPQNDYTEETKIKSTCDGGSYVVFCKNIEELGDDRMTLDDFAKGLITGFIALN